MKKEFTLSDIYVFTLVKTENGLYRPMTDAEILAIDVPQTGEDILDSMRLVLARHNVYRSDFVAKQLGVKKTQLNMLVHVFFGMPLRELLSDYRRRWLLDLVRYTNLEPAEVAKLAGFRSVKSMYVHFTNIEKETFFGYRKRHQKNVSETIEKYRIE